MTTKGSASDQFCADFDGEIDCLVYKLYELTEDKIAIVEKLRAICIREGHAAPVICTPHELMV